MDTKVYLNVQHIKVESKRILEHFTMLILALLAYQTIECKAKQMLGKKKALE